MSGAHPQQANTDAHQRKATNGSLLQQDVKLLSPQSVRLLLLPPIPKFIRPNSYASAAASGKAIAEPRKTLQPKSTSRLNPASPVDERIFLRLEQDATERLLSPYPLLLHYRKFLGENAALLKEVQHVPSGLALRPSSETAAPTLGLLFLDGIKEGKLKGAIGIEKAQNLVTYLISSIPRSFTALNDDHQLSKFPITSDLICEELKEEKGVDPVAVLEEICF